MKTTPPNDHQPEELKPCPFCGNKVHWFKEQDINEKNATYIGDYWIKCYVCHKAEVHSHSLSSAFVDWNTRASDKKLKKCLEFIRKLMLMETNDNTLMKNIEIALEQLLKEIGEI